MMLLLFLACVVGLPNPDNWVTYSPSRGGLLVKFPAKPSVTQQFNDGTEVDLSEAKLDQGRLHFQASYSHFPKRVFDAVSREHLIDSYLKSTPLNPKYRGQILEESKVKRGNLIFRVYVVHYTAEPQRPWTKLLVGIVNQNLIQVQVQADSQDALKGTDVMHFFESFEVKVK